VRDTIPGSKYSRFGCYRKLTEGAERFSRTLPNSYSRAPNAFRRVAGDAVPLRGRACPRESGGLFQDAGNPDEQVGDHVAAICFVPFDTVSIRLNSAFLHDAIALAEHDDAGLPVLDLMFGDVGEAHDGEDVPSFSLEGSRAIEDDLARTGIAGDGVGLKAISVCHIAAQDALVRYEPAFLHQVGGDGQAAFVLQIAICDCGAVNLRF